EEQKQTHLIPLARGEVLGAFGLTEPNAGSDAGGTKTTAIEDGNDFVINGEKSFITNASFASAIIVTAITGKDKQGKSTISAFIVPTDLPGMTITNHYGNMAIRRSDSAAAT